MLAVVLEDVAAAVEFGVQTVNCPDQPAAVLLRRVAGVQ